MFRDYFNSVQLVIEFTLECLWGYFSVPQQVIEVALDYYMYQGLGAAYFKFIPVARDIS